MYMTLRANQTQLKKNETELTEVENIKERLRTMEMNMKRYDIYLIIVTKGTVTKNSEETKFEGIVVIESIIIFEKYP